MWRYVIFIAVFTGILMGGMYMLDHKGQIKQISSHERHELSKLPRP